MIIHGDCIEVMGGLVSESIDLVVTSPPYNLDKNVVGSTDIFTKSGKQRWEEGYENYGDSMGDDEYVAWQRACISEILRLLKPTGALFYNHRWQSVNLAQKDMLTHITAGFPLRQTIIWYRGGGYTLVPHRYFPSCYEVIFLIAKEEFKLRTGQGVGDVWRFPPERNSPHPAPFPVALPERCIRSSYGSIVLDPFLGSGTTAVAAIRCGWDYIGIDNSLEYIDMAKERVGNTCLSLI